MRDLELRGAGNILGAAQSGHVATVGFDLYCQLLRRSVSKLQGKHGPTAERCEIDLDFLLHTQAPLGPSQESHHAEHGPILTATLPSSWLPETRLRIEAFRRLALIDDQAELRELEASLINRYGPLPPEAAALIRLAEIRCLAETKGVVEIKTDGTQLKCLSVAQTRAPTPILIGNRFPRLTVKDPLKKLQEIRGFLSRLPAPPSR
jgi:transcription-repair coupling factor (superfamily II helicase)